MSDRYKPYSVPMPAGTLPGPAVCLYTQAGRHIWTTAMARRIASELVHAAELAERSLGQSCVCSSCGTFFAAERPGQACTCGQPLVAVEASL